MCRCSGRGRRAVWWNRRERGRGGHGWKGEEVFLFLQKMNCKRTRSKHNFSTQPIVPWDQTCQCNLLKTCSHYKD